MSYRVMTYPVSDLAINYQDIAHELTRSCYRPSGHYRITGLCQSPTHVCFPAVVDQNGPYLRYVLAPIEGQRIDELTADLNTRNQSGFVTLGMIDLGGSYLGLYAIPQDLDDQQ